jgi:tRNA-dihydrouridine synthase B
MLKRLLFEPTMVKSLKTQMESPDFPVSLPLRTQGAAPDRPGIPALRVGALAISPPLLLAPMAGLTHTVLRQLVASFGGCGCFYTEMLSARAVPHESPDNSLFLMHSPAESPLVHQIVTAQTAEIIPAVQAVERCGAAAIDLNMGCAAPAVLRLGAGAALMRDVLKAERLVLALRRSTRLPVLVKIRLGWEMNQQRLLDFCRLLEGAGADALVVHARLCGERFRRPARWALIAEVKRAVSIPVIGNGDVVDGCSARRMVAESGCDGVMIGRAGVARPWLFRDVAQAIWKDQAPEPPPVARLVLDRFIALLEEHFPEERRLGRLKAFTAYFARNFCYGHALWKLVHGAPTLQVAHERAVAFLQSLDGEPNQGCHRRLPPELGRHG